MAWSKLLEQIPKDMIAASDEGKSKAAISYEDVRVLMKQVLTAPVSP